MRHRITFLTFGLIAIIGLAACASAGTSTTVAPTDSLASPEVVAPVSTDTQASQPQTEATATQPAEVQPVATSRGPNLEATDPSTVNLASGQLQLVEFFRFT